MCCLCQVKTIKVDMAWCEVWIEKLDCIPNTIELAGKTSKTNDKWQAHKQCLVKALACPCEHPSVVKVLVIHSETMEVYTLWWNGGTLWEMLDYNMKYSPATDNWMLSWKEGLMWNGKDGLSSLGEIVWRWHGHSWTSWV